MTLIGKVSDEWFMQLSHKYEVERMELKTKIKILRQKLSKCGGTRKLHFGNPQVHENGLPDRTVSSGTYRPH